MVRKNLDHPHVQLILSAIQSPYRLHKITDYCCQAPLETLQRLVLAPETFTESIHTMLAGLAVSLKDSTSVPKEGHIIYTVMFWGTSTKVVEHFLDQVPKEFQLDKEFVQEYLLRTRCFKSLASRLIKRCGAAGACRLEGLLEYRPDLAEEPDVFWPQREA